MYGIGRMVQEAIKYKVYMNINIYFYSVVFSRLFCQTLWFFSKHFKPYVDHVCRNDQVYFSNRSAAYLKLGDAKSKALKDAEKCMELAPEWSKSFSRLGAAQHALRRFDAAVQTLKVPRHSY